MSRVLHRMHRLAPLVLACICASTLAACGGGGGRYPQDTGESPFLCVRDGTCSTEAGIGGSSGNPTTGTGGTGSSGGGTCVAKKPWPNPFSLPALVCDNFCYQEDAQAYYDLGATGLDNGGVVDLACEDKPRRP